MTGKNFIYVFIFSVFLISCKDKVVFENEKEISNGIWEISDTLNFNAPISDTVNYYNIFITVDAIDNFLTNNLWLFISSESPSGNILNDTVMFYITDERGKWYGKKHGDIIKNKFVYKPHIRFPEKGEYKFLLRHGMRENDLPRVSSVGIQIEKSVN